MPEVSHEEAAVAVHQTLDSGGRGAVYTRPEVVSFMLDIAGYSTALALTRWRVLEPAAGDGAFAAEVVVRLIRSYLAHGGDIRNAETVLAGCLVAVEVFEESASRLRGRLATVAMTEGLPQESAARLASKWVVAGDFLLLEIPAGFDLVVGNPPYVRQESIPDRLLSAYRLRFSTIYNRADLYVLFFEKGLELLNTNGRLIYICSDRWMKCAYGKRLRAMVADGYRLDAFVDMVDTPAFMSEVVAYPAITMLSRRSASSGHTMTAFRPRLDPSHLAEISLAIAAGVESPAVGVRRLDMVVAGSAPWLVDARETLPLVRDLEARFPVLEAVGCRVGIGVATGRDRVFIGEYEDLDVEPDRKLRLVMADCIRNGRLEWGGKGLVNPFEPDGSLADIERYPRFAVYLRRHEADLRRRNVALRAGAGWYRTIDRVWHSLVDTPKLLIPDIKGEPNVVLDHGGYYPHHNLYWVTSAEWGLEELQAMLRSSVSKLIVGTYCVKMANGYMRFQAQYIRRIRLPAWPNVSEGERQALREAARTLDQAAIDDAAARVYKLGPTDVRLINRIQPS
jgi:hypothetical protein